MNEGIDTDDGKTTGYDDKRHLFFHWTTHGGACTRVSSVSLNDTVLLGSQCTSRGNVSCFGGSDVKEYTVLQRMLL